MAETDIDVFAFRNLGELHIRERVAAEMADARPLRFPDSCNCFKIDKMKPITFAALAAITLTSSCFAGTFVYVSESNDHTRHFPVF